MDSSPGAAVVDRADVGTGSGLPRARMTAEALTPGTCIRIGRDCAHCGADIYASALVTGSNGAPVALQLEEFGGKAEGCDRCRGADAAWHEVTRLADAAGLGVAVGLGVLL